MIRNLEYHINQCQSRTLAWIPTKKFKSWTNSTLVLVRNNLWSIFHVDWLFFLSLFSFSECPDYYGQGFAQNTGHFTHMVWKSCKTYGIWAQTCDVPGTSLKCVVALKMDCSHNLQGSFDQNIGNVGQCTNVKA